MERRLFIAIEPPLDVREELALIATGVPGAAWVDEDALHLTLRFLGDVDGIRERDLCTALRRIDTAPFELTLGGIGFFPPRGDAEVLWMGVEPTPALSDLRTRVDRAVVQVGLPPERRKWVPHVTLARLRDAPATRLQWFAAGHNLWKSRSFEVAAVTLFRSTLLPSGAHYTREEVFPLRRA